MTPFEFFGVGRIVFGRGAFRRAAELARGLGQSAMVIYNGSGQIDRLEAMLKAAGVDVAIRRQRGEPVVADVDSAVSKARERGCDLVIGLGGGSAIDAAKAVAALLSNGGGALDYMEVVGEGRKITKLAMPWMAIATTAGTGAEATRNAVIGFPPRQFKASIRSEMLLPRIALIDPELGVEVPPEVTARCGMDALCQLIESYTSTGAGSITDPLALQGIGLAARSLARAYRDGRDIDARQDMALAALLSGMTLTSAGLGAVHGLAAPLGANFPVPHGTVCAALLPRIIEENVRALRQAPDGGTRGLNRYAAVGRASSATPAMSDPDAIDACIGFTRELARELRIPPLKEFGLREDNVPAMIALSRKASSMRFNPIELSDDALTRALIAAI